MGKRKEGGGSVVRNDENPKILDEDKYIESNMEFNVVVAIISPLIPI